MTSWKEHPRPAENLWTYTNDWEWRRLRAWPALPVEQGCKYSQVHMSVMYEHERKARTTSRLQPTHKGWRFATESPWTLWHSGGPRQGHPLNTGAQTGKAVGGPTTSHDTRRTTRHRPVSRENVLSGNKYRQTLVNLHGSGAARRSHGKRAVKRIRCRLVHKSKWRRRRSPVRRSPRTRSTWRWSTRRTG